jgi:hypothetical protein
MQAHKISVVARRHALPDFAAKTAGTATPRQIAEQTASEEETG